MEPSARRALDAGSGTAPARGALSLRPGGVPPHHRFEPRLHAGPLVVEDAEVHRVARDPALVEQVLAQDALLDAADPPDRRARGLIERVRLELDPDAPPGLEGVSQH